MLEHEAAFARVSLFFTESHALENFLACGPDTLEGPLPVWTFYIEYLFGHVAADRMGR